jgi:hypothetical protein
MKFVAKLLVVLCMGFSAASWGSSCPTRIKIGNTITQTVANISADSRFVCVPLTTPCPTLSLNLESNQILDAGTYGVHTCSNGVKTYGICGKQNSFTLGNNVCP